MKKLSRVVIEKSVFQHPESKAIVLFGMRVSQNEVFQRKHFPNGFVSEEPE